MANEKKLELNHIVYSLRTRGLEVDVERLTRDIESKKIPSESVNNKYFLDFESVLNSYSKRKTNEETALVPYPIDKLAIQTGIKSNILRKLSQYLPLTLDNVNRVLELRVNHNAGFYKIGALLAEGHTLNDVETLYKVREDFKNLPSIKTEHRLNKLEKLYKVREEFGSLSIKTLKLFAQEFCNGIDEAELSHYLSMLNEIPNGLYIDTKMKLAIRLKNEGNIGMFEQICELLKTNGALPETDGEEEEEEEETQ